MPAYEWRGGDTFRDHANDREIAPGEVVSIAAHIADAHPEFTAVDDEAETASADADDTDTAAESGAEDSPDVSALAGEHWKTAVNAVASGEVDDALDALADVDERTSVQDAIEERRDELAE